MQFIKITLLGLICTIIYGILQDQITARLCVEYFTIGHSRIFGDTEDPTLLALGWGVLATWWVGLILGVPLAVVARIGSYPQVDASRLVKPILILMASVAFVALIAGIVGYLVGLAGGAALLGNRLVNAVPRAKHAAYLADAFAHMAAYGAGFGGGLLCWAWTWRIRSADNRTLLTSQLERLRNENLSLIEDAAKQKRMRDQADRS
jgi:hypothetical protein